MEELKQQVRILQAVGYGAEEESTAASSSSASAPVSSSSNVTLEGMLLAKNRRLEHDVTMLKLQAAECNQQVGAAQSQVGPCSSV